jgi:hypothetical protein
VLGASEPAEPLLGELDKLDALLSAAPTDDEARQAITVRLQTMLLRWTGGDEPASQGNGTGVATMLDAATPDELFAFIDSDLNDLSVNSPKDSG